MDYLVVYGFLNISIITYYEVLNELLLKDSRKQLVSFEDYDQLNKVIPLTLKMVNNAAMIQAEL
jgi:tRNA(fMet)-specific endonuclease VapC